jgi:hypothetical protein
MNTKDFPTYRNFSVLSMVGGGDKNQKPRGIGEVVFGV